jgi:hypothetical protein
MTTSSENNICPAPNPNRSHSDDGFHYTDAGY